MKITFLNPPFIKNFSRPQRSPAVTKSGTLYYPMWLSYAAGLADSKGYEVDLIDAPADGYEDDYVLKRIAAFAPDMVVVETSTPSIYNDVKFCSAIKGSAPKKVCIVIVGTHVTALPEESLMLAPSVDAVAVGEFDLTIVETADAILHDRDLGLVPGLCLKVDGKPLRTGKRPPIEDLDILPFVSKMYKRFLNPERYFNPNALFPMVTITTSRGCPHQCTFCVYPQTVMGHKLRVRSTANVVDEIEYITKNFEGVKSIFFEDDTFPANKKRCIEICEEIIRRGIRISWTANARADLDYETMRVMHASGCRSVCVGFESGSQNLLDTIKKRITVDKMSDFMIAAKKAGILVHGCFMIGLPGETRATAQETLDLAKRLNPDTMQFYPIMVYPGTEAYEWYKSRHLIITDDFSKWITPAGLHNTVVRTEQMTPEEMVAFCDKARREFYLRPSYLFYKLWQTFTNPQEMKRNLKSARTFIKYLFKGSDIDRQRSC